MSGNWDNAISRSCLSLWNPRSLIKNTLFVIILIIQGLDESQEMWVGEDRDVNISTGWLLGSPYAACGATKESQTRDRCGRVPSANGKLPFSSLPVHTHTHTEHTDDEKTSVTWIGITRKRPTLCTLHHLSLSRQLAATRRLIFIDKIPQKLYK